MPVKRRAYNRSDDTDASSLWIWPNVAETTMATTMRKCSTGDLADSTFFKDKVMRRPVMADPESPLAPVLS